ncbi:MAG TPA: hypothetical protein VMV47_17440 [Bacteroidales bacterium]|nr:hypothetical protein [Bacteroidales bacterium]
MKKLTSMFILLLLAASLSAQGKPKKTFDATAFGKQVVLGIAYDMDASCANENAKQYISKKTGMPAADVTQMVTDYRSSLETDLTDIRSQKLPILVQTVDVEVIEETPVKKANLIIHSNYKGTKIDLRLTNCIQTDQTWVLGDHIIASGDGIAQTVAKNEERKANTQTGVLGKLQALDTKQKEDEAKAQAEAAARPVEPEKIIKGYVGKRFGQIGLDGSTRYIHYDKIGLPLKGYIISNSGVKTDVVIAYQESEKLFFPGFDLAICKEENNKKADILNPQNEPNFDRWVKKEDLKAFYVGDQLFYQAMPGKWFILMSEGALKNLVSILKITNNGKDSYKAVEWIQKLDSEPVGKSGMTLNFKTSMSSLVSENKEMALKITNKAEGYQWQNIITVQEEFNIWYELQSYLPPVKYVLSGTETPVVK